ncbi:hypothetical protein ONS95_008340 [Cadophora gregata]|uniref:uncharacterized protein n=1 Tax=Cadophora gregata TaxID=51156 RepID=UPI0026DAE9E5|nr:uncharacterized protein ONS95_008340 [Cadophora gregata]KAK0100386.1 hypothetical protein ONS96_007667 [Cadophora gregata f. sp. sojae]KAK0126759.1 hypothetical protein ONS95_008340 [Cadophora gregata]
MLFNTATITAVAALLTQTVTADFHMYKVNIAGRVGWSVYDPSAGAADCSHASREVCPEKGDDVSGSGVRCKGACKDYEPGNQMTQIEMNTGSLYGEHFTFYQDRNNGLYDTNNNRIGDCAPGDNARFDCGRTVIGSRKLTCYSYLTADRINSAYRG